MAQVNQAAFAALHGVSRKTVTAWKARGWLVLQGDQVDVDASNARLKKYRREGLPVVTPVTFGSQKSRDHRTRRKRGTGGGADSCRARRGYVARRSAAREGELSGAVAPTGLPPEIGGGGGGAGSGAGGGRRIRESADPLTGDSVRMRAAAAYIKNRYRSPGCTPRADCRSAGSADAGCLMHAGMRGV